VAPDPAVVKEAKEKAERDALEASAKDAQRKAEERQRRWDAHMKAVSRSICSGC
jgi:hypothetical protein